MFAALLMFLVSEGTTDEGAALPVRVIGRGCPG